MRRKGRAVRNVAALLFCASLLSCTSFRGKEESKLPSLKAEEMEGLAAADPISALDLFSSLAISDFDKELVSRLALKAERNLARIMAEALSAGRIDESLRYASSLHALSLVTNFPLDDAAAEATLTNPSAMVIDLLTRKAESYMAKGLYTPGILEFLKAQELSAKIPGFPESANTGMRELASLWIQRAQKQGDEASAGQLAGTAGMPFPGASAAELDTGKGAIAKWALGVVTVQVDKGLKIFGGMAVPDKILGSGFQVDEHGYYLTNYHVIASEVDPEYEGYSKLSIRPSGNPEARVPAKVIGWNADLDLALIKSTEISSRTFFMPGSTESPRGTKVYAIGSPVGLENSISSGIISASGRRLLPRGEVIQIDVPLNPGNSGGPLLDEKGALVGIVFAGLSGFQGLNFALPSKWIKILLPALFEEGKVENPWLGLALAKNLDSSIDIIWDYPDAKQCLPGDRLEKLDGIPISGIEDAQAFLASKPIGSLVALGIRRGNSSLTLVRKVVPAPELPLRKSRGLASAESIFQGILGIVTEHVSGRRGEGGIYLVQRVWPGLPADESGLSEGDTLKFQKMAMDVRSGVINLDISVKSRVSGYLERTLRLAIPLESSNFL